MAVRKVRPIWNNAEQVIQSAQPGDVIRLVEGTYHIPAMRVENLHFEGVGDPRAIIIEGAFEVRGNCTFQNLTVHAPEDTCAFSIEPQAHAVLRFVGIVPDPAEKKVGIFAQKCQLLVESCTVFGEGMQTSLKSVSAAVAIAHSQVKKLELNGGKADIVNATSTHVWAKDGAHVACRGPLYLTPVKDKRGLVVDTRAAVSIEQLIFSGDEYQEGYVEDASLTVSEAQDFSVVFKGECTLSLPDNVKRVDKNPKGPKVVEWRAEEGTYAEVVKGKLKIGDTLRLFEGSYDIGIDTFGIQGVTIEGVGNREEIVWNSQILISGGKSLTLRNFTIKPPANHNALLVDKDASLEASDLKIFPTQEGDYPNLAVRSGGMAKLDNCVVTHWRGESNNTVFLMENSQLTATGTSLSWLKAVDGAQVTLKDCGAKRLFLESGAKVVSTGSLQLFANDLNMRPIVMSSGATLEAEIIRNDDNQAQAAVNNSRFVVTEIQGDLLIFQEGESEVDAGGDAKFPQLAQPEEPQEAEPTAPPAEEVGDPLEEIQQLIGLTKVKEQIAAFVSVVKFNEVLKQRGKPGFAKSMHSMFLGNPGTGKTTVARLLGRVLYQAGAIRENKFVEVGRQDLVAEHIGGTAKKTQAVLESALGGVLFLDEAYTLHKEGGQDFGQEAVDTILTFMENHRDDIVIIFAGYTKEMQDFLSMNPGLESRVPNRFDFEDYSPHEIADMGIRGLHELGFTFDETRYRKVIANKYALASDESNGRWVRNFNEALLTEVAKRFNDAPTDDPFVISDEVLDHIGGGAVVDKQHAVENILAELDALIGLEPVKKFVRELVAQVAVDRKLQEAGTMTSKPAYHMVFTGNPGTGKTTVARIVGKLFYNLGLLDKPDVYETGRSELVGAYIGHTERNTERVLKQSMGGVLFVDEAYQLTGAGSGNDFGPQAVETMLVHLENNRDKFVAIFAGYTANMEEFLATNPGLRSRVPLTIEFPDYTAEEIAEIVDAMLSKSWEFDHDLLKMVVKTTYESETPENRANGRWARLFAEQVEKKQKNYISKHPELGKDQWRQIPPEVFL